MILAMDRPYLSVVIPVYNELATIGEVLTRVQAVEIDKEIVIIDDGSTDGTTEFLENLSSSRIPLDNLRILFQKENQGKGAALRRAFQEVRGDVILIQDADLEYNPRDYPRLLQPIEQEKADVVYGSRFRGEAQRVLLFWHYLGNQFLTLLSNVFTDLNLSDVWTGYKVFRREVLEGILLEEKGFGFEPEVTAKVARGGWRIYEVPISYWGRTYSEGKKITWKDGFQGIGCILRYNLFSGKRGPEKRKTNRSPQIPHEINAVTDQTKPLKPQQTSGQTKGVT